MGRFKELVMCITGILVYVAEFILFEFIFYGLISAFQWSDKTFTGWLMKEIKVIFSHPENFCFTFGMLVILGSPLAILICVKMENIWEKISEKKQNK